MWILMQRISTRRFKYKRRKMSGEVPLTRYEYFNNAYVEIRNRIWDLGKLRKVAKKKFSMKFGQQRQIWDLGELQRIIDI